MQGDEGQEQPAVISEEDILNAHMPVEMQEELFCFTMGDCSLHGLNSYQDKQKKTCEFIHTSIHITTMEIADDEGRPYSIPLVVAKNDEYDEDQEQKPEEKLPITENLIFMRYSTKEDDDEDETIGYVFYYPELDSCKVIECENPTDSNKEDLRDFEKWICKVLYIINERKNLRATSRSEKVLAE